MAVEGEEFGRVVDDFHLDAGAGRQFASIDALDHHGKGRALSKGDDVGFALRKFCIGNRNAGFARQIEAALLADDAAHQVRILLDEAERTREFRSVFGDQYGRVVRRGNQDGTPTEFVAQVTQQAHNLDRVIADQVEPDHGFEVARAPLAPGASTTDHVDLDAESSERPRNREAAVMELEHHTRCRRVDQGFRGTHGCRLSSTLAEFRRARLPAAWLGLRRA